MRSLSVSNRGWIIITTVLLISLCFALYFLVYVRKQGDHITAEGFRTLRQLSINIRSLENTFLSNARSIQVDSLGQVQDNKVTNSQIQLDSTGVNELLEDHVVYNSDRLSIRIDQSRTAAKKGLTIRHPSVDSLIKYSKIKQGDQLIKFIDRYDKPYNLSIDNQTIKGTLFFSASYEDFFGKSKINWRDDVFHHYLISKVSGGSEMDIMYLYKTFHNELSFDSLDQILGHDMLKPTFNATISSVDYKVFNHVLHEESGIYLSGLIKESTFSARKKSISPTLIIFFTLAVLLLLLSMPLLKLSLMSNEESLHAYNVVLVGISLSFGPAILLFLHFTTTNYFAEPSSELDEGLITLNQKIENNFKTEIALMHQQKESYEDKLGHLVPAKFNIGGLDFEDSISRELFLPEHYKFFNYAFWADKNGLVKSQLSNFEEAPFSGDLSHRKYITEALDNPYRFKIEGKEIRFFIESIRSVSTGSFEAGVGFASELDDLVFAISTKLNSVMDPVLEPGFGFCLFDDTGRVLFHSDITKNLNENFLEEVNHDNDIMTTIGSKVYTIDTRRYDGEIYRIHVRPMSEIPLNVATFYDHRYYGSPLSQTLSTSFLMFLINYAVLGLIALALMLPNIRRTKLMQKEFFFNWMQPIRKPFHCEVYRTLLWVNSVAAVYLLLVGELYKTMPTYTLINVINILAIVLLYSYRRLKKILPSLNQVDKPLFNKQLPHILFIPIALQWGQGFGGLEIIFNLINTAILIFVLYYLPDGTRPSYYIRGIDSNRFSSIYKNYILSWLVLISLVPSFIFYRIAYKREYALMEKFKLDAYLDAHHNRGQNLTDEFADKVADISNMLSYRDEFDRNDLALKVTKVNDKDLPKNVKDKFRSQEETRWSTQDQLVKEFDFDRIYFALKPSYNELTTTSKGYVYSRSDDGSWLSQMSDGDIYLQKNIKHDKVNERLYAKSRSPKLIKSFWFWFIFFGGAALVAILYRKVLTFSLSKIYCLEFLKLADNQEDELSAFVETWRANRSDPEYAGSNHLVVIGLRHSSKIRFIERLMTNDRLVLNDFTEINEGGEFLAKRGRNQESIIIKHLEYRYHDHKTNRIKLKALESLMESETSVIITSEINPSQIFNFYHEEIKSIELRLKNGTDESLLRLLTEYRSDYQQWQHVLGGFKKVFLPLNFKEYNEELEAYPVLAGDTKLSTQFDDRVLNLQITSHPYYHSIWNSLSTDERYIVYDMAHDGFLNCKNVATIINLMKKGIIVYDHSFRLMNASFTNFILTQINQEEALQYEIKTRGRGSWNTISIVMTLIIVSIVFFLSFGQQNFLDDINALLTALATVGGLALRFGGVFKIGSSVTK